jgi:cation transport ATPase
VARQRRSQADRTRLADRASQAYAPVVHALALLAFAGWMAAGAGWHASLTIAALATEGLSARILSGDRAAPVAAVAATLGLAAEAEADPRAKLAALEALKAAGRRPLMVGGGLNDGPALAAAHASIAPGTASDASQQAADAVFIGEPLMPVALAVRVAKRTMRTARQNFGFSIAYNALAVPLALAGQVTPLVAAIAMSVSSLVVIGPLPSPPGKPLARQLCNGGTITIELGTIPVGGDKPAPDRDCHPKGCHAGTCREREGIKKPKRTI